MITKEILNLISGKLRSVIAYLVIIGVLFFILAVAILFYPQVLQFLFVLCFFAFSFLALMIALKINHIKQNFDKVLTFFPKKRKTKK
ncbi:MAG TPA: hypothetical protein ENN28_00555 [Candidatus Uhrbacteria bacterium]|nr:hypothetical protein [Candidatus Uhrbacteria bacterium]